MTKAQTTKVVSIRKGDVAPREGFKPPATGRWRMSHGHQFLLENPKTWLHLDILAREMYGSPTKVNIENTRKHVPRLRDHMLNHNQALVTRRGGRGKTLAIKLFDREAPEDIALLNDELDRAVKAEEMSHDRAEELRRELMPVT